MQTLAITRPDDWHLHLRDGDALASVAHHSAARFARAIVMPNLSPPVVTTAMALAYRERILAALAPASGFEPLMTLCLTDNTAAAEIALAAETGCIKAVKYYPAGATTNSDRGVTDVRKVYPAIQAMQEAGLPLLIHGEVTGGDVDIFDREAVFVETILARLVTDFPALKIVLEHISTRVAVEFVLAADECVAATITPQHMLLDRNALFRGGLRPHHYCLPILKPEPDRQAVMRAAMSGNPKFFLGTDSAPHARDDKERDCGCAGIYSAHIALELYAEAFDRAGQLARLEAFASFHGPDFYGLPRNRGSVTLARREQAVPERFPFAGSELIPFRAGGTCAWRLLP